MKYQYPPEQCTHCQVQGLQYFFHDTTSYESYRCRICGQEHYPSKQIFDQKRNIRIQGYTVHEA